MIEKYVEQLGHGTVERIGGVRLKQAKCIGSPDCVRGLVHEKHVWMEPIIIMDELAGKWIPQRSMNFTVAHHQACLELKKKECLETTRKAIEIVKTKLMDGAHPKNAAHIYGFSSYGKLMDHIEKDHRNFLKTLNPNAHGHNTTIATSSSLTGGSQSQSESLEQVQSLLQDYAIAKKN